MFASEAQVQVSIPLLRNEVLETLYKHVVCLEIYKTLDYSHDVEAFFICGMVYLTASMIS